MRRLVVFGAAAAIAAVAVFAYVRWGGPTGGPPPAAAQPAPPAVSVASPVVREIVEQDEYTGRFDAIETVEVRARVSGYLESIHFRDGAMVSSQELLMVIDQRPYQVLVNQAQANVASAQTRLDFYRADLERAERLARTGVTPERTFDERRQQFLQAQADINAARAALDQARLNLSFTEIKAPIGGRISRRLVTEGNLVTADQTLLTTIVALDPIYFYFDVDERSYLSYMRDASAEPTEPARGLNRPVELALGDEREPSRRGRLDFVDNRIDQSTGTIRARAMFDNSDHALTPGLFGRIRVAGSLPYRGILVPDEAIGADQDRRFVYVVAADGTVQQRIVRPGPRQFGYRVIRQGLEGNEKIVVAGLQRLRPGARVTPREITLPAQRQASTGPAQ